MTQTKERTAGEFTHDYSIQAGRPCRRGEHRKRSKPAKAVLFCQPTFERPANNPQRAPPGGWWCLVFGANPVNPVNPLFAPAAVLLTRTKQRHSEPRSEFGNHKKNDSSRLASHPNHRRCPDATHRRPPIWFAWSILALESARFHAHKAPAPPRDCQL